MTQKITFVLSVQTNFLGNEEIIMARLQRLIKFAVADSCYTSIDGSAIFDEIIPTTKTITSKWEKKP